MVSTITTIDGIPVFDAILTDGECGMQRISLVDSPAVMTDFMKFSKDSRHFAYSIESEEKRIIFGPVMRADFPIYRYDQFRGEYYVVYRADTIREMAEKYLAESRQNIVNLAHEDGTDTEGIHLVDWFIKDTAMGLSPKGFEDVRDGSLFASFHVLNDEVWAAIKDGTYKGFSLEGIFDLAPEKRTDELDEIVSLLQGRYSSLSKITDMSKLKELLARLLKCGNVTTDNGVIYWDTDADLAAGDKVFIEDAEGNRSEAPDGDYRTEDGKVIVIVSGEVAEIKDAEAEVAPEAQAEVQAACEPEPEKEKVKAEDIPEIAELKAEVEDLKAAVEWILSILGDVAANESPLPERMAAITDRLSRLEAKPMAEAAHEEVEHRNAVVETGIKGLDRLARIINAK